MNPIVRGVFDRNRRFSPIRVKMGAALLERSSEGVLFSAPYVEDILEIGTVDVLFAENKRPPGERNFFSDLYRLLGNQGDGIHISIERRSFR